MHNSWKEMYISKMNFKNTELNFKNETRKIKTRDIHTCIGLCEADIAMLL
jgi:hypothetical protein